MKRWVRTPKAFTLVEIIVSLVIVTVIGLACWTAVNVLTPASHATILRNKAEHLITLSQEELHQYSQQFDSSGNRYFDTTLSTCTFDTPENNPCGFPLNNGTDTPLNPEFSEYHPRLLTYMAADSTSQLKKFDLKVSWNELGKTQQLDSVILLARPPDPLPGNIYGTVVDNNGNFLSGVQITAYNTFTHNTNTTYSQLSPLGNYTFAQPETGYFQLAAGTWTLTASKQGYTSEPIGPITVPGGSNIEAPQIVMNLNPTNATITANLVDSNENILAFNGNSSIQLAEDGSPAQNVTPQIFNGGSSFVFNVAFNSDQTQRCFTLYTSQSFLSQLAGLNCSSPPYQSDGWSSAQMNNDGSPLSCSNAWEGSSDPGVDRICVNPGQNLPINVTLAPVPTTTITVNVTDTAGNKIPATAVDPVMITIDWHQGGFYSQVTEAIPGPYTIRVPAEQDLFPSGEDALITAQWNAPLLQCCTQSGTAPVKSNQVSDGDLLIGQTSTVNLPINTLIKAQTCGNAQGLIADDSSLNPLSGASVNLASISQITNANPSPNYIYQCQESSEGFLIPSGQNNISVSSLNYYPYPSNGSGFNYYIPAGPVTINANVQNDLPSIGLWPIGKGTITGRVTDGVTNAPLSGITVVLTLGSTGTTYSTQSNENGNYSFANVQETWPPSLLQQKLNSGQVLYSNYNTQEQNYVLSVASTSAYEAYSSKTSFTLAATDQDIENIVLTPKPEL